MLAGEKHELWAGGQRGQRPLCRGKRHGLVVTSFSLAAWQGQREEARMAADGLSSKALKVSTRGLRGPGAWFWGSQATTPLSGR